MQTMSAVCMIWRNPAETVTMMTGTVSYDFFFELFSVSMIHGCDKKKLIQLLSGLMSNHMCNSFILCEFQHRGVVV